MTSCIFCGPLPSATPILGRKSPRHVICRKCGFVYQSPMPTETELAQHYKETYWEERDSPEPAVERTSSRGESIAQWLVPYISSTSAVLEIGCGPGHNLIPIRAKFGCKVAGIDPSPLAVEMARLQGFDVNVGDLKSTSISQRMDAVVLCHVLEHLVDPIAQLRQCHSLLQPIGILLVEVPNIFGSSSRKNPKSWLSMEHLWYFSPCHLRRALALAGFRSIRCEKLREGPVRILAQAGLASEPPANEYFAVRRAMAAYKFRFLIHRGTKRVSKLFKRPAKSE